MTTRPVFPRTLLEQAKLLADNRKAKHSIEEIDLALAWLKGDITTGQASRVLSQTGRTSGGNALYAVATALRTAYQRGLIGIVKQP